MLCTKDLIKGNSVRIVSAKAVEYDLFWIRNEKASGAGIFLAKKWVA